jgi:hypothetical protein
LFALRDYGLSHLGTGLSIEGIANALRCFELELQGREDAWADFDDPCGAGC